MKPLSLTMTAFGTYKDTTVIDFAALGGEGIFLITGSTGAGKTTIFDAICYALFGQTSSLRRGAKMLASDFAAVGTGPEVELVFRHRGQLYTIHRWQPCVHHRDGTVEMKNPKATLLFPDGRLLDKLSAVNRAVEEDILHLTYAQFKQVVMIAQGEFRELLEADTEQLEEVMVVAFGTAKKSAFTGSAAVVGKEEIAKHVTTNVANTLVGSVPGLQMRGTTGQPGSDAGKIKIRGIASLYAGEDPLVIVDGAPYTASLSNINPDDIESVSVLKDAASAALYGARGAAGVIIITTKKDLTTMQLSASMQSGVQTLVPFRTTRQLMILLSIMKRIMLKLITIISMDKDFRLLPPI